MSTYLTTDLNGSLLKDNVTEEKPETFPKAVRLLSLVALVIGAACIATNLLTLVIVYRRPVLRHRSRQLLVSLAAADVMVGLGGFAVAGQLYYSLCGSTLLNKWLSILESTPIHLSMDHMVLIAFDRFLAVIFPLRYETLVTTRRIRMAICLAWILNFGFAVLETLLFQQFETFAGCYYDQSELRKFLICLQLIFYSTLLLLAYMYCRIWCVARSHARRMEARKPKAESGEPRSSLSRRLPCKATKTITAILVTFLLAYQPVELLAWLYLLEAVDTSPYSAFHLALLICLCLVLLKSCLNFFIYAVGNRHFYQGYKSLLKIRCGSNVGAGYSQQATRKTIYD